MSKQLANLLFVVATIGWGSSYLFTKFAVAELQPFTLLALRFGIAFIVAYVFFFKRLIAVSARTLGASVLLGGVMCAMFTMFNYVLQTVNPSTAGFLLATTVIFVPLVSMVFTHKLPQRQIVLGALVTLTGLCIFMFNGSLAFDTGSLLCIMTAMLFALHLVINNFFARHHDSLQLGVYQLGFAALFGAILMMRFETVQLPQTSLGWMSLLVLAVVCSAFGFVVQSVAQKYTSAEETGFILALEPIFSAVFAYLVLGEILAWRELVGAFIIFGGVLLASHQPKAKHIPQHSMSHSV